MQKVILYYKFVEIADPETAKFWQRNLCERLGLKGRIIIADHGINGTLGGDIKDVKAYVREMNTHPAFKGIEYKWSDGSGEEFPKLSVKVRSELVTLAPEENFDVFNSTRGLRPKEWHEYIKNHPEVTILDARNDYESDIGAFENGNVIKPGIGTFKEIKREVEKLPKDQTVLTYCTGDIRCEYLSAYMKHQGFDNVYHLDGGIVKYGEEYGDGGYWQGKCFVFDQRLNVAFSEEAEDIGECVHCQSNTSRHTNCANLACNRLLLVCERCEQQTMCSETCSNDSGTI